MQELQELKYVNYKYIKPIFNWVAYIIIFIILILVLDFNISDIVKNDNSNISIIIITFFIAMLVISFINTVKINFELAGAYEHFYHFKFQKSNKKVAFECLFTKHVEKIKSMSKGKVSQSNLIEILNANLSRNNRIVDLFSTIMITLGFVGTLLGLVVAIGGLDDVLLNIEDANGNMIKGMQRALSGIGVAFYTTLMGAIFGGIMLRLLSGITKNAQSELICLIAETCEVYILPELQESQETGMLKKLDELVTAMKCMAAIDTSNLKFISDFNNIGNALKSQADSTDKMLECMVKVNSQVTAIKENGTRGLMGIIQNLTFNNTVTQEETPKLVRGGKS